MAKKCKYTQKRCEITHRIEARNGDHICCGINIKPKSDKNDVVNLCLKGELIEPLSIEMTRHEALMIISALSTHLWNEELSREEK